ncbi:MAG: NYN domain-containing protein [Patescibacteria group bacterium]
MPNNQINWQEIIIGKAAIFIDASNILYSQKTLGFRVDYAKLKNYFMENMEVFGFYYYTGKVGKFEKQLKFINRLEDLGFRVLAKEVKFVKINQDKRIPKGNLDVELALDAYRLADSYQTLILCSGDSDFAYLIDLLKGKDKRVIVVSTRGHISRELLERAKYIDLRKLRNFIEFVEHGIKNQELPAEARTPEV